MTAAKAETKQNETVASNGSTIDLSHRDPLLRLARDVSARNGLSPEAQKESAELFGLIPDVKRHPDAQLLSAAMEMGFRALLADPENAALAKQSRKLVQRRIQVYRAPLKAMTREAPTSWLLFGLFTLMICSAWSIAFAFGAGLELDSEVLGFSTDDVILVFLFGAFGSMVSILRRVADINEKRTSPVILFWTGFTKPMVGALFALFFYALVRSKVIAIDLSQYEPGPFFAATAFLAGFSERFVPDLAKRVEGTLAVREQPQTDSAASTGDAGGVKVDVPEDQVRGAAVEEGVVHQEPPRPPGNGQQSRQALRAHAENE